MLALLSSIGTILLASENISSAELLDSGTFNPKSDISINPKSKAFGIWKCGVFLISSDPCPYCRVKSLHLDVKYGLKCMVLSTLWLLVVIGLLPAMTGWRDGMKERCK